MPAINLQTSASGPKLNLRIGNTTYVLGEQKTETVTNTVYVDKPVYVDREVKVYVDKYIPLVNYEIYMLSSTQRIMLQKFDYPVQITGNLKWGGTNMFVFGSYTSTTDSLTSWKICPAIWVGTNGKVSLGFTGDGGAGIVLATTTTALSSTQRYPFTFRYKPSESRLILTINNQTLNKTVPSGYGVGYLPFRLVYEGKDDGYITSLKLDYWDGN